MKSGPTVPVEVYDTLVETVRNTLGPLDRQIELKRKLLDADEFRMWDVWVPMAEGESPNTSYEQACEWIEDAVAPLGEDAAAGSREMLRLGSRKYPLDLLDGVGVDMTEPDPIESAIGVYDEYVDEVERLD